MSELWYAIHGPDDHLTQGDLVEKCPLIGWTHEPIDLEDSDRDEVEVLDEATQAVWADVVVMTRLRLERGQSAQRHPVPLPLTLDLPPGMGGGQTGSKAGLNREGVG